MSESTHESSQPVAAAERRILDAIAVRAEADFTGLPEDERRIPAAFLQRLLSGAHDSDDTLCCALRVRGASIIGPLLPPTTQGRQRMPLQFTDCEFDAPVDLSGTAFLVLRFIDCRMPAFIGASLEVSADLDLSGCQFSGIREYSSELARIEQGAVHLNSARIGGNLDLSSTARSRFTASCTVRFDRAHIDGEVFLGGATIDGCGAPALSARSAVVGSNVEMRPVHGQRFEARGELAFVAARVTGDLNCNGARIINPEGRALHCEDLKVESVALIADGEHCFEASGRLNFLSAIVGGSFFLSNARLAPGPDYDGMLRKGGPVAINLRQARISNALAFNNVGALQDTDAGGDRVPVQGWFLLTGLEVNTLVDDIDSGWPAHGFLDLEGATYARIRHLGDGPFVARRIAWLRRQYMQGNPDAAQFRPQPYEQLSQVLREHGLAREANAIAVEKIRMRLAARVDRPWTRLFPRLLMLVSHYGYSSARAILSFIVFILLGAAMYATAVFGDEQPFVPVESDPAPATYALPFGLAETSVEDGCPGLDVVHYALDAALPVIDVGQDQRCRFTPAGERRSLWLLLHSLFVIAGAALSAVVVLTLTGVLRQD